MLRKFIAGLALSLVAAAGLHAQGITQAQLDSARAAAADTRKQTVAANMMLDSATAKKFWPVYDAYRTAIAKVRAKEWKALSSEISGADTLSNAQVNYMTNMWLSTQMNVLKLRQQYYPRFQAVLKPKQVARYFQIEHRMDLLVQMAVAQQIPLIM